MSHEKRRQMRHAEMSANEFRQLIKQILQDPRLRIDPVAVGEFGHRFQVGQSAGFSQAAPDVPVEQESGRELLICIFHLT